MVAHKTRWGSGVSDDTNYRAFIKQQVLEVAELYEYVEVYVRSSVHKTGSNNKGHKVGKLRITCDMKGSDGKWNEGIHINIVKREENGPAWVDNIKSRGKNYPYQKFTWGSITWGSLRNPSKGYGTGSTTTKDEARQQHSDKHSGASSMVNSGEAAKGKAGSGKASSSGGGSGSGSNPSQPVSATKTNVVYGDYTYTWDAISSAWYYQLSDGTTDWADDAWSNYCEAQQSG